MGSKGNSRHIKRLSAPKYFSLSRKEEKFATKPNPGRHTLNESIALITVIRDKLDIAKNSKEARVVIHSGAIEVNGNAIRDVKYPVGLNDTIYIKGEDSYYLVRPGNRGAFEIEKSSREQASSQLRKVVGKYKAKKGAMLLRLHDGSTVSAAGIEAKVNDSVVVSNGKISKVIKFEKGGNCEVVRGIHAPQSGKIVEIKPGTASRSALIEISSGDGNFETVVENIMMVA